MIFCSEFEPGFKKQIIDLLYDALFKMSSNGCLEEWYDLMTLLFDCDNKVMVDTMAERKTLMEKHADVFFIAPGGIGTMDEFFQVLTLKYLKRIDVPIVVINLDGFYDTLIALIKDLVKQGAVTEEIHKLYDVITDVNDDTVVPILKDIIR